MCWCHCYSSRRSFPHHRYFCPWIGCPLVNNTNILRSSIDMILDDSVTIRKQWLISVTIRCHDVQHRSILEPIGIPGFAWPPINTTSPSARMKTLRAITRCDGEDKREFWSLDANRSRHQWTFSPFLWFNKSEVTRTLYVGVHWLF